MVGFRHVFGMVFLFSLMVFAAGCGQKVVCAPPNVMIGDTCCLDADGNGLCDAWQEKESEQEPEIVYTEPAAEEPVSEAAGGEVSFAETFAQTWDRKSYTALRNLFVKDVMLRYSPQEFNFLARRVDSKLGITSVSLVGVEDGAAQYKVYVGSKSTYVSADIDGEDGGFRHDSFYLFDDLTADAACGDDSSCFMSFAKLSGDRNYCDKAGSLKIDCLSQFGVSKSIIEKIDGCIDILEYYGRAECLTRLAVNENDIEPCWQAGQDKQVFECMGEVAAARKNVDECDAFVSSRGYPGTRLQKTYCILGYVRKTADTDACAKIDRRGDVMLGAMQEGCYKLSFP
ncbi:hypothetical protein JW898_04260 [Candidatus Woesearchaeota archaeon]|nr:hypothetical protein [Candidatus Woesearchaeota archaeon]